VGLKHLRSGNIGLENLLHEGHVVCHLLIVGELACGNLSNRSENSFLLQALPLANHSEHEEVMHCHRELFTYGKRVGFIDMHLIASAILTNVPLWTLDKKLKEVS